MNVQSRCGGKKHFCRLFYDSTMASVEHEAWVTRFLHPPDESYIFPFPQTAIVRGRCT